MRASRSRRSPPARERTSMPVTESKPMVSERAEPSERVSEPVPAERKTWPRAERV